MTLLHLIEFSKNVVFSLFNFRISVRILIYTIHLACKKVLSVDGNLIVLLSSNEL